MAADDSPARSAGHAEHSALPLAVGCALLLLLIIVLVGGALWLAAPAPGMRRVADLPADTTGNARKQGFFNFLRPVIAARNNELRARRGHLARIRKALQQGQDPDSADRRWLQRLAGAYGVKATKPQAQVAALWRRIDTIPTSLALAQAAIESAWGQSRFARRANNLFGEWCYTRGCGLVPKKRPSGAHYEVRAFDGVGASVASYFHNLNSHSAYAGLRSRRAQARARGRTPRGYVLAAGLGDYSAIGGRYIDQVRAIIRHNDLESSKH